MGLVCTSCGREKDREESRFSDVHIRKANKKAL